MLKITCIITSSGTEVIAKHLSKCLESIQKSSRGLNIKIFIVLVLDKSSSYLAGQLNVGKTIVSGNIGFGSKNNLGVGYALENLDTDYFLFINDDILVNKVFFKEIVMLTKKNKNLDIVCPNKYELEYLRSGWAISKKVTSKTTIFSATCLLISSPFVKKVIKRYGNLFNTVFYYYYEDVELSIRMLSLNPIVIKTNKMNVFHGGQSTFKSDKKILIASYHSFRNWLWTIAIAWPKNIIYKNFTRVIFAWLIVLYTYRPVIFIPILIFATVQTLINLPVLLKTRKKTLANYPRNFNFESVFSENFFYTRKRHVPFKSFNDAFNFIIGRRK